MCQQFNQNTQFFALIISRIVSGHTRGIRLAQVPLLLNHNICKCSGNFSGTIIPNVDLSSCQYKTSAYSMNSVLGVISKRFLLPQFHLVCKFAAYSLRPFTLPRILIRFFDILIRIPNSLVFSSLLFHNINWYSSSKHLSNCQSGGACWGNSIARVQHGYNASNGQKCRYISVFRR